MKMAGVVVLVLLILQPCMGFANARRDTLRGALVGAATGALLSERSSDISARTAIPVFAGIGALTGYAIHQHRYRDYYGYGDYYPHGAYLYGIHPYYHPIGYRQRWSRQFRPSPVPVRVAPAVQSVRNAETATTANRHPGVTRIPVSITLPNGFPITITITQVGNQYVGPRGETYTTMPTAGQLQEIYRP